MRQLARYACLCVLAFSVTAGAAAQGSVSEESVEQGNQGGPEQQTDGEQADQRGQEQRTEEEPANGNEQEAADGNGKKQDADNGKEAGETTPPGADESGEAQEPGKREEQPEEASPEPDAEPLTPEQLLTKAREISPANTRFIYTGGQPMAVFHDLQQDGLTDVAVVAVDTLETDPVTLEQLSDMNRLFDPDAVYPGFYLEVYVQTRKGGIRQLHTFYLGKKGVFSAFRKVEIARDKALPVALSAVFFSADGQERNWATFAPGGEVSLFVVQDTPAIQNAVLDVDSDGFVDVLEYQTTFEEARGYETFITWYRWSGASYRRHDTTNIVRNLNTFLQRARKLLLDADWDGFARHALLPAQRPQEDTSGESGPKEIMRQLLEPIKQEGPGRLERADTEIDAADTEEDGSDARTGDSAAETEASKAPTDAPDADESGTPSPFSFLEPDSTILEVVFPEILENPFPEIGRETAFIVPVRIVCCDNSVRYFSAEIVMRRNPFADRQFFIRRRNN